VPAPPPLHSRERATRGAWIPGAGNVDESLLGLQQARRSTCRCATRRAHDSVYVATLVNAARWNEPPGSRSFVVMVAVALAVLVLAFRAAERPVESVAGSDVTGYERYGSLVLDGAVPYRDFDMEYPPGSLALFVPPATSLVARGTVDGASWSPPNDEARRYYRAFTSLVLLLLALILVLTAVTMRAMNRSAGAAVLSLAVVACSPLLLGQVLIERFDVLPAAFMAAALAASVRDRYRLGGAMLGLGAAAKLYPALLIPLLAIVAFRQRGRREAFWVAGIAIAAAVAVFLPFAVASLGDTWASLQVQFRGGLQIETLASSVLVLASHAADALGIRPFELVAKGAGGGLVRFDLGGPGVVLVKTTMSVLLVAALCWLWVSLWRSRLDLREELLRFAAATIAAVLALGTILSPQYVAWLLPVVGLVGGRRGAAAVVAFVVAAYLTNVWIPDQYFDYQADLEVGPTSLLLARNLALVTVLLVLLVPGRVFAPRSRAAR
jgi:hypothetical protein